MSDIVQKLIDDGVLKTPEIIKALRTVKRSDFLPASIRARAEDDAALPTFANQTISQPYTVAFMLELLQPEPAQKILDIGSGSGWVAAILARIVGKKGRVYAIERISELVEFCRDNLKKYHFTNLEILLGDGTRGLPQYAPYDRIHVAAAAQKIPVALREQMAVGGRMVIPTINDDIRLIEKISKNRYTEKIYPGFVFVPLIEE